MVVVVLMVDDEGCFGCTNPCLAGLTRRSIGGVSEIVVGVAVCIGAADATRVVMVE